MMILNSLRSKKLLYDSVQLCKLSHGKKKKLKTTKNIFLYLFYIICTPFVLLFFFYMNN